MQPDFEAQTEPQPDPLAGRRKRYWIAIILVIIAMIALAMWAWWIPYRVFDPWITAAWGWLGRIGIRMP